MTSRFNVTLLEKAPRVPGKPRHKTREVKVGERRHRRRQPDRRPVDDHDRHLRRRRRPSTQIHRLEEAGCELVRVTVPKPEDAGALSEIKKRIGIPLICDIHFDYKMALAALDHPIDKIRINPGNIGGIRSLPPGRPQGEGHAGCRCGSA